MTKISNQYSLTNVLFADAVNGRVGIGTSSPTVALDVVGAGKFTTQVNIATSSSGYTTPSLLVNAGPSTSIPLQAIADSTGGRLFRFYTSDFNNTTTGTSIRLNFGAPTGNTSANLQVYTGGEQVVAGSILSLQPSGGNVGIGTTSPAFPLTVNGNISSTNNSSNISTYFFSTYADPSSSYTYIQGDGRSSGYMAFRTNDIERMRISSSGNITQYVNDGSFSIYKADGTTLKASLANPDGSNTDEGALYLYKTNSAKVQIRANGLSYFSGGNVCIGTTNAQDARLTLSYAGGVDWAVGPKSGTSSFAIIGSTGGGGGVYVANGGTSWAAWSDRRVKKNIESLEYGLDKILSISPVRFDYLTDEGDNSSRIGFIAQDVQEQMPEIVNYAYEDILGMSSTDLVPVLVKAIQELKAEIDILKNK